MRHTENIKAQFGGMAIACPSNRVCTSDQSKPCAGHKASQLPSVLSKTSGTTQGPYLRPSMAQTDLPGSPRGCTGASKQCKCSCSWERRQIKGRVSLPLLQSDIKISLDEKCLGLLLFV